MMINNVISTTMTRENNNSKKESTNFLNEVTAEINANYLSNIKGNLTSNKLDEINTSSKLIENLDIKTTKSILLNKIINKCNNICKFDSVEEGELLKIDNVKLDILDKDILRQMLLLKSNALKGYQVQGLDINNMITSMIKDYSFVLTGKINDKENVKMLIKIPFEINGEFENSYNIDDLLLGNVSLIGIYKNKNKKKDLLNNTFNYFYNMNNIENNQDNEKYILSNSEEKKVNKKNNKLEELEYHYIDIIAIIQNIKFKQEKVAEDMEIKNNWLNEIIAKIKNKFKEVFN